MPLINTTVGPLEDDLLMRRDGEIDNDNETTTTVEYCLVGCNGPAHVTGIPDSPSHFCNQHVHRSAHVTLKKNVAAEGVAASFV